MKNQADFDAGWTGKTFNPKTGKWCSGGAARNRNVALQGGAQAVKAAGFAEGIQFVAPLLEQTRAQLEATTKILGVIIQKNPNLLRGLDIDV
ncbi:hypothetical protein AX279_13285 [Pseudomonas sp. J237]|uniref:Uncharacterized protein n=1 Tax=viral metagenome TaxID=1070528 RepID=A0A6M3M1L7_9ZZZZ|nr:MULTISPECIES: hypothetical protein [Pseudomonas]MBU0791888.1 hypothetical protein [Gammaproteobacteria bacterium]MBU0882666.1 hypothetical protein [Gammaproteobacteria bacterium]MBU1861993.1 hypothetical protein [Gammaproteobacteria bacterium]OEO25061.1 hypothetical protein AX279_13285 [Pseudomonas sp. J237]